METTKEKKQREETKDKTDFISNVCTFEDLLDLAGAWGPWNTFLLFICAVAQVNVALHTVSYQFLGATPDHWCSIETLKQANWTYQQVINFAIPFSNSTGKHANCYMYNYNYTAAAEMGYDAAIANRSSFSRGYDDPIRCYSRDFNLTQYQSTVVTEWDLVCERRALYSTTQAIVLGGNLAGYGLCGYISDMLGRRNAALLSYLVLVVSAFVVIGSPNEGIYIFMKFLISMAVGALYLSLFILQMETCPTRHRSVFGALMKLPFALGYMAIPGIAYFVRPWRMLHLAFALPLLLGILLLVWLPESPRWLIIQGRYKEALTVLTHAAKMNAKTLPQDDYIICAMTNIGKQSATEKKTGVLSTIPLGFKLFTDLLILREYRVKSLVSIFCCFTTTMMYYGVSLAANVIHTDPYLFVFLGGFLEVPGYFLLWAVLYFFGRRSSQVMLLLMAAICTFTIMTLLILEVKNVHWVIITLSLCSKIIITAVSQLVWVYTAELYPTKYRSAAMGQTTTLGRIGTICAPYINDLMGAEKDWGPPALFGSTMLMSSGLTLLLPETQHLNLTEPGDSMANEQKYDILGRDPIKTMHADERQTFRRVPNYSSIKMEG